MADEHAVGISESKNPAPVQPLHYGFVLLLALGYASALLDRGTVALAELTMGKELGLSEADFGLASGLFFIPYCAFQIPCVRLMPALGAHRVLAFCLICWGAASVATAMSQNLAQLCGARIILGAFEAGYLPGAVFYLSQCFPAGAVGAPTAMLQGIG